MSDVLLGLGTEADGVGALGVLATNVTSIVAGSTLTLLVQQRSRRLAAARATAARS